MIRKAKAIRRSPKSANTTRPRQVPEEIDDPGRIHAQPIRSRSANGRIGWLSIRSGFDERASRQIHALRRFFHRSWANPQTAKCARPSRIRQGGESESLRNMFLWPSQKIAASESGRLDGHEKLVDDLGGRLGGSNGVYQVADQPPRRAAGPRLRRRESPATTKLIFSRRMHRTVPPASLPALDERIVGKGRNVRGSQWQINSSIEVVDRPP